MVDRPISLDKVSQYLLLCHLTDLFYLSSMYWAAKL